MFDLMPAKKWLLFSFYLAGRMFSLSAQPSADENSVRWNGHHVLSSAQPMLNGRDASGKLGIVKKESEGVTLFYIQAIAPVTLGSRDVVGLVFDNIGNTKGMVALWRYKPWNSWTKPIALKNASDMPDWDVQFIYWKNKDGSYGAAIPLNGNGYRTTLGSEKNRWGSKSVLLSGQQMDGLTPALALAYGNNPFELFKKLYQAALTVMGKGENQREKKTLPDVFNYIGWCTWNSSNQGKDLNEEHITAAVKTFTDHHFPLGWVLIDDGWFQHNDKNQLLSYQPDPKKFPGGFLAMNNRLKQEYGIKYMGIWHAFDGYWNGIDTASALGKYYSGQLFSWKETDTRSGDSNRVREYFFIKPGSDSLSAFYDNWYRYFKSQGFDFTKVDNQLVTERMALNNYPVFTLSEKMHQALYNASRKYFGGSVINCMDMTPEAYLNFGSSAVARTGEDYFPYKKTETYNLQEGNAAAHVLEYIYNSLYFSQMVYPDFDMFQSHNPNAVFHAIARALNCGPIYITDKPGEQHFDILNALVFRDGHTIHAETPLLPTADCLFQVQDKKIFKAFSKVGNVGLLGIWNAADTDQVSGNFSVSDIENLTGDRFVIYEYFSKECKTAGKNDLFPVHLGRMGYKLYYAVPLINGFAPLGLTDKYNAPATILEKYSTGDSAMILLYEGGSFKAYALKKPKHIRVNGQETGDVEFEKNILEIRVPYTLNNHPKIEISW